MDPGTSSLVAALAVVCAVLVACAAAGVVLLAARTSGWSVRTRERLESPTSTIRQDAPRLRDRLATTRDRVERLDERWTATDRAMTAATASLASARGSLQGITQGRLATLIRGAGFVSKAAQLALLWR